MKTYNAIEINTSLIVFLWDIFSLSWIWQFVIKAFPKETLPTILNLRIIILLSHKYNNHKATLYKFRRCWASIIEIYGLVIHAIWFTHPWKHTTWQPSVVLDVLIVCHKALWISFLFVVWLDSSWWKSQSFFSSCKLLLKFCHKLHRQ